MNFSDNGEDAWILEQFEPGYIGIAVDVGAYNGLFLSNTLLLEEKGWTVLCVEPQPGVQVELRGIRKLVAECACGSADAEQVPFQVHTNNPASFSSLTPRFGHDFYPIEPFARWETVHVPVRRLSRLLTEHGLQSLDVLCVDTESTELDVLAGLDFDRWKPRVAVIESWDSPNPIMTFMAAHGYVLVERRHPNDLFVRRA